MPREAKSQTTIRSGGGESTIAKPTEHVISGRLFIQNPYSNVVSNKSKGKLRIADAARNLGKSISEVMDVQAKRIEKRDFQSGQEAALVGDSRDFEHYKATVEGQSPAFTRGMAAQTGRKNGYKMVQEINQELENGNFQSDQDVDKLFASHLEANLEGIEDEDYRAQVLEIASANEDEIRESWRTKKQKDSLEVVTTTMNASERNDMRNAAAHGATVQEMHSIYRTYQDQAGIMGITNKAAGEMAIANIEEAATATGRPELFNIFEIANQTSDNPDVTLPGIANSPKMHAKIVDAKKRVVASIKSDTNKRAAQAEYALLSEHQAMVHKEDFQTAMLNVDELFKKNVYTGKQAIAEKERIFKLNTAATKKVVASELAATGQLYAGAAYGLTDKEIQEGMTKFGRDQYAGATEETMPATHAIVVAAGLKNGIIFQPHKQLFNSVSPLDAEGWVEAAELIERYKQQSPEFIMQNIDDEKMLAFNRYRAMTTRGIDPESARGALLTMGNPEVAEKVLIEKSDAYDKKIDDSIVNNVDIAWSLSDGTVHNARYVRDRVKEGAKLYISLTDSDADEALEHSMSVFLKNHSVMQDVDEKYIYTYHGGVPLPENFNDVTQALSDKLVADWEGNKVNGSEHYTLHPNPYDPTNDNWIVMKANGTPVIVTDKETSYTHPKTINRKALVADYNSFQEAESQPKVMSRREHAYWIRNKAMEVEAKAARKAEAVEEIRGMISP